MLQLLNDPTAFLAKFGAITGTIGTLTGVVGLVINILNYKRDNADIVITIQRGMKIMNAGSLYDSSKTYTNIRIANRGRRKITISTITYTHLKNTGGAVLTSSLMKTVGELDESKATDCPIEENGLDFNNIAYFSVNDVTGKEYRKYVTPFYKRAWYNLLHFTKIKRKPSWEKLK